MSLAIFIEDNGSRQKNHKRAVLCQPSSLAHLNTICQVQLLRAPQISLFQPPKELGLFTVSASQDSRRRTGASSWGAPDCSRGPERSTCAAVVPQELSSQVSWSWLIQSVFLNFPAALWKCWPLDTKCKCLKRFTLQQSIFGKSSKS